MTDAAREESETGKFSMWVHEKNSILLSDIVTIKEVLESLLQELSQKLETAHLSRDALRNVGVNVKNLPADYPSSDNSLRLEEIYDELGQKLETAHLSRDALRNVGVNVRTITEEVPDAATKNNGSYLLYYDGDGRLQHIHIVIGGQEWRKTLSYTTGRLTGISSWTELM